MTDQTQINFFKIKGSERTEIIKRQILRATLTQSDLRETKEILGIILHLITQPKSNSKTIISMTIHAIISYTRCFNSSFNYPLKPNIFNASIEDSVDRSEVISEKNFHYLLMNYRNKHIAHSDDLLKSGDVGGVKFQDGYVIAPIIASRVPYEDQQFYLSMGRLCDRALETVNKRLKDLNSKLLELLRSEEAKITSEPSQLIPIPLNVDPLEMWGLTES